MVAQRLLRGLCTGCGAGGWSDAVAEVGRLEFGDVENVAVEERGEREEGTSEFHTFSLSFALWEGQRRRVPAPRQRTGQRIGGV